MEKAKKILTWLMGTGFMILLLGGMAILILKGFGLMFRGWVVITLFVILVLSGISLASWTFCALVQVYWSPQEDKGKRVVQKISAATGICITIIVSIVVGFYALVLAAFGYQPEHVIEKYDQKMVAYVNSFLNVDVEYYEYKNFLVRGTTLIGEEWYGNGGYDPFEREKVPEPKRYAFYDTEGNLLDQSETESESETEMIPETRDNSTSDEGGVSEPYSTSLPKNMQCTFSDEDPTSSGQISYSIDGENWSVQEIGYHYQYFFDNTGYLIFSYDWAMHQEAAAIYKSNDGGSNWIYVAETPSNKMLQNVVFFDENTGIFEYGTAGTESYLVYGTADGGETAEILDLPAEFQGLPDMIRDYLYTHPIK